MPQTGKAVSDLWYAVHMYMKMISHFLKPGAVALASHVKIFLLPQNPGEFIFNNSLKKIQSFRLPVNRPPASITRPLPGWYITCNFNLLLRQP